MFSLFGEKDDDNLVPVIMYTLKFPNTQGTWIGLLENLKVLLLVTHTLSQII